MQPHPLSAVVGDIDRQYLANIHHLRHKIALVQHDQREISLCLERIRSRVRLLIEGRPGIVRNTQKNNLIYCSLKENNLV